MMKRIISMLLTVVMVLGMLPLSVFADSDLDDLTATASETEITLRWDKEDGAKKYTVSYKKSGTADKMKELGTFSTLSVKINKLKSGTAYDFTVKADNGASATVNNVKLTASGTKKYYAVYDDDDDDDDDRDDEEYEPFETAAEAVENMDVGINIGNSLDSCGSWLPKNAKVSDFEKAWGNPQTTQKYVKAIADAGFEAVRLPITWNYCSDSEGNIRKDYLDRVQQVVDWILAEDMYCIINVHHDTGTDGWIHASEESYKNGKAKFANIWKQVAERFKDYPEELLFESMNETLNDANDWNSTSESDYRVIKKWHQTFVDTVRASGGRNSERNLVINPYAASSNSVIVSSFELPKDTVEGHMIMEVHNYDPQGFTWKNVGYDTERSVWGTTEEKRNMENLIDMLARKAKQLGVPVIIGEFSSDNKNNESERAEHAGYMVKTAAKKGIVVFWWDNGDPNGCRIIDRNTGKITMPEIVKALVKNAD